MNRIQNLGLTFALLICCLVSACDTPDETAPLALQDRSFTPNKVGVQPVGAEHRLTFTGTVDATPVELYVDLQLDGLAGTLGATHNLGGETFFETAHFARFLPFAEHSTAIVRAYATGTCSTCAFDGSWQLVTGTIAIDTLDEGRITGRISMVLEGDIPQAGGLRNIRTMISGPFVAPISAAMAAPAPAPPATEPSPTPGNTPTTPEPTPTPEEPTPSVEPTEQGLGATEASPVYEATLYVGWGLNLATGETFKKANFANSDLYATAGNPYLKLTPGGPSPTKGQPLRWFKNSGGFVKSFGALTDVPLELPTDEDGSQSIVSAKPYMGFIVKANLSQTFARVWVRNASADQITLEYQLITAAH